MKMQKEFFKCPVVAEAKVCILNRCTFSEYVQWKTVSCIALYHEACLKHSDKARV